MRIILSGGGTLGPVTPLIALWQELDARGAADALWVGTRRGPEGKLVVSYGINFRAVTSAKLRRAFDIRNIFIPFFLFLGFLESFLILLRFKPALIVSAGGFVSVPLVWASWFCGVPAIIHQEDIKIGLANLLMAPFARVVTTALPETAKRFPHPRVRCIGNPVRKEIYTPAAEEKEKALEHFGFSKDLPVLLVLGGGTGSEALNKLILAARQGLQKYFQILHLTGAGKGKTAGEKGYLSFEFLGKEELFSAYHAADIVLSRAGMGVIGEVAVLGKPVILVPIPKSSQEANAEYFGERNAAVYLRQEGLDSQKLTDFLVLLAGDGEKLRALGERIKTVFPPDSSAKLAEICLKFIR